MLCQEGSNAALQVFCLIVYPPHDLIFWGGSVFFLGGCTINR